MILHGDVLEQLRPLASNSVHCVVTSPPYWSLRDYHVPPTIWGGDPACTHAWTSAGTKEGYGGKKKWQHSMTNEPDSNGRGEPRVGKKRSRHGKATKAYAGTGAQNPSAVKASVLNSMRERITVGWRPTCKHTLNAVEPCVVLDPFGGTGTTGMVAAKHGRDFILIELSAANIALTHDRLATTPTRREDVPA